MQLKDDPLEVTLLGSGRSTIVGIPILNVREFKADDPVNQHEAADGLWRCARYNGDEGRQRCRLR